jgi:hypothetical protein
MDLVNLLNLIIPHVDKLCNDFPSLKGRPVSMLDAGSGMHYPGVIFAMLGDF